ncbi:MAG: SAM-dependent methyltransferase [Pseudomonadales bacterium]|nr:SAM-dependent methyltransferase [Pseudomonadales bacterium]
MQSSSRPPSSNQGHIHPRLAATVRRHLQTKPRKPPAPHNDAAFDMLLRELAERPRPLVLDSFCGTGHSTAALARRHPGHLVVGIDKSLHRLSRHPENPGRSYLLLRAECEDFWRRLVERGIVVAHHYLLYPNPWPKAKHLQRRIHGSAAFYWLPRLAPEPAAGSDSPTHCATGDNPAGRAPGRIELRSNWQTYVEEFGLAMQLAGYPGAVARVPPAPALSLFERKYRDSGHDLWRFTAAMRNRGTHPATVSRG